MVDALAISDLRTADGRPLADNLAEHLRARIEDGRLRSGDRLPTIRELALRAGTTRATVQRAYRRLADAGLVCSTVGRGTVVAERDPRRRSPFSRAASAALEALRDSTSATPIHTEDIEVVADFAALHPDSRLFPVDEFRESLHRTLTDAGRELLGYSGAAGSVRLRSALADRHGGDADADRVLITSGAQQGIELAIRAFVSPGEAVAVAVPSYHQMFGVVAAHGAELVPIDAPSGVVDPADVARALRSRNVRLLYVMPSFHNPTGVTLDTAQRAALMEVVAATDVPVLEDEYECELRFAGTSAPSLASFDPRGLTLTTRSFSKALFPGVRLGWMESSPQMLAPLTALKRFSDLESSPFLQEALFDFVASGAMDRHLQRVRSALRERHAAADAALAEHVARLGTWSKPAGGLALWMELAAGIDADRVANRAATEGVLMAPGRMFDPLRRPSRGVRLSLSRADLDSIRRGIAILGRCVRREAGVGPSNESPDTQWIL